MQGNVVDIFKRLWQFALILWTILHTYYIFIIQKMLKLENGTSQKLDFQQFLTN